MTRGPNFPSVRKSRRALLRGLAAGIGTFLLPPVLRAEDDNASGTLLQTESAKVSAQPIASFERGKPDVRRFGALEFRGGLRLSSSNQNFGGLSGLVIEPDGSGLLAVTDVGGWVSGDITYDGTKPTGLANVRMGPLRDGNGKALTLLDKKQQDGESITLLEGTLAKGTVLVGFERNHRLVRYQVNGRALGVAGAPLPPPPDAKRMPRNQGFEAVALLKGGPQAGAIIAFAERFTRGSGYHTGWIWSKDGEPQKLQLQDIDGFDITDATGLDNGDLLVLERRFRWTEGVQMRLRRLSAREIRPGARITGETLLTANGDYVIDNMEGVAVHRDANGQTVVTLISDDNFNHLLQSNLLLQFTLLEKTRSSVRT